MKLFKKESSNLPQNNADKLSAIKNDLEKKGYIRQSAGSVARGVCYVLFDYSESMKGEKIGQAKAGAKSFVSEAVKKGYEAGLIKFSTSAELVCNATKKISALSSIIDGLSVDESTNLAEAIRIARKELSDEFGPRAIVIITDGKPNSKEAAFAEAALAKKAGIDVLTIGTDGADEKFLRQIATREDLAAYSPAIGAFAKNIALASQKLPLLA